MSIKAELLEIKTIEEWNKKAEYFKNNNLVMNKEVIKHLDKILGKSDNEILDNGNIIRDFPNLDMSKNLTNR